MKEIGKTLQGAFTLAEVLITLAIIGVVSAMTIPTLVANINEKVNSHQKQVVTSRFVDGLNQFNIMENGLARNYNNTYEFLQGLSAHYKMSAICDADHLSDCLPYSQLNYDNNGTVKSISSSELKAKLKFPDKVNDAGVHIPYLEPAGFISAGGTPFIVAFSSNCADLDPNSVDPDKKMNSKDGAITSCISGIYDLNGTRTPNQTAKDVVAFNGADVSKYLYDDGTIKVISVYKEPGYFDARQGTELYTKYGIKGDGFEQDYWVWGMEQCAKDGGTIPTMEQLAQMATRMYKNSPSIGTREFNNNLEFDYDSALANAIGMYGSDDYGNGFSLWSSEIHKTYDSMADHRHYTETYTAGNSIYGQYRYEETYNVVCLGK